MKVKVKAKHKLKSYLRWDMLYILDKIDQGGEYSNVVLDRYIQNSKRDQRDIDLLVRVVYGSVQRRKTLDFLIEPYIQGKKVDSWVRSLLRMSVFQMVYLDRIPNYAIVDDAVTIAKTNGHQGLGKFVNGVLRQFMRQPLRSIELIKDPIKRLAITYSIDDWLVEYFSKHLSEESLEVFLASLNEEPLISARINLLKITQKQAIDWFNLRGMPVEGSPISSFGLRFEKKTPIHSDLFKEGALTIQDESSMLVAPLGQLKGHEKVLDACAAPGGKATHIASLLDNGHLWALDISKRKLKILADHLDRMNLSDRVTLHATDALKYSPDFQDLFDVIYLDAPCSGTGLMRRKPEIKYRKDQTSIDSLCQIQDQLLEKAASLLKPGGRLIYSTCSLVYEENEYQVQSFLKKHSNFMIDPVKEEEGVPKKLLTEEGYIRVWPQVYHTDGFFISRFIKSKD